MNTDTELLRKLVEALEADRANDIAAAAAWSNQTDHEHDRLTLEGDRLFAEVGHAAIAARRALSRLLEAVVPEGQAGNEPDRDLWMRVAFFAIKAAEKQNGVRLIPMGDEDAEAFMDSVAIALEESMDEIMTGDLDAPHPPSEGEL